jgi:hypothetical protein
LVVAVKRLQREVAQVIEAKEKLEFEFQQFRSPAFQSQTSIGKDQLAMAAQARIIESLASELEHLERLNTQFKSIALKLQGQIDNARSNTTRLNF